MPSESIILNDSNLSAIGLRPLLYSRIICSQASEPTTYPHTMNLIDWIGSVAAILTTASFVPQAWHTFRTRDVSGISLSMYSLFTAGVALWLVYGILMEAWPIIIANIITTSLALMILLMKLRYR
ncbi:MAG: hypothetical protein RL059_1405 [Bacteroidota bacterium]